jgi:3-dehydroquinate dehydratase-2
MIEPHQCLALINGPNLNTLGEREPGLYGTQTLEDIVSGAREAAEGHGFGLVDFQSNHEGAIIDFIQECGRKGVRGAVINPGALSHYSYALRDAIAASGIAFIEVHITNIHAREEFRRRSVTAEACRGSISGLGAAGYTLAIQALAELI